MRKTTVLVLLVTLLGLRTASAAQNCPNALLPRLSVGRPAHVTPGAANNLRQTPGTSAPLVTQVPGNSFIDVIGGPQCADNLLWWQIFTNNGQTGWMAEAIGATYILEPVTTSTAQFSIPDDGKTVDVQFGNVEFVYNGVFGKSIQAATLLPVLADPNSLLIQPAPAAVNFIALPAEPLTAPYYGISLSVYPVSDYIKVNNTAQSTISRLAAVLSSKPPEIAGGQSPLTLPPTEAGEIFHVRLTYLSFNQGAGVRFLTTFAMDAGPITNQQLVYIFQGLSTDQRYLITAYVPLKSTALPAEYEDGKNFPDISSPNAGDQFRQYFDAVVDILNKAPDTAFTPNPTQIDAMLQSIKVR